MYSGGFYPYETLEEYWAYWSRYIYINCYMDPPKPVYDRLYEKYYSVKVVQSMEIKRKKDGSIEGITTMGDSVKEKFTDEEKKRQEMKRKYDKKYAVGTVK